MQPFLISSSVVGRPSVESGVEVGIGVGRPREKLRVGASAKAV